MNSIFRLKTAISVLMGALLVGCGSSEVNRAPVVNLRVQAPRTQGCITVRSGETLFTVASRNGVEAQTLALINGIKPPYRIYPGQKLYFSTKTITANKNPKPSVPIIVTQNRSTQKRPTQTIIKNRPSSLTLQSKIASLTSQPKVTSLQKPSIGGAASTFAWQWPIRGPMLRAFHHDGKGKGIDIGGSLGSPVKAAAKGVVVYSGNALKGYGNLIIIKHNEDFLSAYAHNRELKVKEGERVNLGQEIATMGKTGVEQVKMHFEIRYKGKPVDPLRYLPKR